MERVKETWNRLRNHRVLPFLLLGLATVLALWQLLSTGLAVRRGDSGYTALPQELWTVQGYEVEDGVYTREAEDAYIQVEGWDQPVSNILVTLGELSDRSVLVTLSYTREGTEEPAWQTAQYIQQGDRTAEFTLPCKVLGSLRFSFSGAVGDSFRLDGLLVRASPTAKKSASAFFLWAIALLCLLALWAVFLCHRRQADLSYWYLAAALPLGIAMMFAVTPFSVPDETYHYTSAYYLASHALGQTRVPSEHYRYESFAFDENSEAAYVRIVGELFRSLPDAGEMETLRDPAGVTYYPIQRLPAVLGVLLGKALQLNFLGVFYWGRLGNLLFSVLCAFLALRRLRRLRPLFFLLGLMPMFLQQAASYSYDAFVNCVSLLLLAYLFSAIYEEGPLPWRDRGAILLLTAVLAPAKGAYFLLTLLAALIPAARYRSRRDKALSTLCYLLAGLLMMIPFNWSKLMGMLGGGGTAGRPVYYTPAMALAFPVETLQIFLRTMEQNNAEYLLMAVGRLLSGLSIATPLWCVLVYGLLLIGAALPAREDIAWAPTGKHRAAFLGVYLLILLLVYAGQFFSWTYTGNNLVQGVQGRYLIPALPLPLLCLRGRSFTRSGARGGTLALCGAAVAAWCVFYVARATIGWI